MTKELISLEELYKIVKAKVDSQDPDSYSYKIAKQGAEKTTRKVGEEALEVVIATLLDERNSDAKTREDLIGEVADLYFHSLILLAQRGISFEEVSQELAKRNKAKK